MEFVSITLVTKSVNQSKHFYQNISFHQANLLLSEKRFLLDIPNSVNCTFLWQVKNLSIGKYSQRGIIFNIDSMTYRIGHTANDKTLSFSVNILKLHSKKMDNGARIVAWIGFAIIMFVMYFFFTAGAADTLPYLFFWEN